MSAGLVQEPPETYTIGRWDPVLSSGLSRIAETPLEYYKEDTGHSLYGVHASRLLTLSSESSGVRNQQPSTRVFQTRFRAFKSSPWGLLV